MIHPSMAGHEHPTRKQADNSFITKCALLGVGAVLGYTYYSKKYNPSKAKNTSSKKIQADWINVQLPKEIDEYFSVALSAAYAAGQVIKKHIDNKQSKSNALLTKSNHADIVTQIDKQCEKIILSKIQSAFPSHKIIAEESCDDPSKHNITDEPTWFIDPIDGTTNFFHGIPFVAVCIGLRINKVPILGIVHCPILDETFHAILGRGAFLISHKEQDTNKKIKIGTNAMKFDNSNAMKQALVLTECGYDRSDKFVTAINRRLYDLLHNEKVRAVRMIGSCAINMCWVAMGRADIFFEGRNFRQGPKPWDYTAAEVIVYEAGGITCDPEGDIFDCTQGRVLCCNNAETAKYLIGKRLYTKSDR